MKAEFARWRVCLCLIVLLALPFARAERQSGMRLKLSVRSDPFLLVRVSPSISGSRTRVPRRWKSHKLKRVENTQPVYRLEGPLVSRWRQLHDA